MIMAHKASVQAKRLMGWLGSGYGVAVYENVDLSSPDVGSKAFLKVGKDATFKKPPSRMPDSKAIPIAWRYYLKGTAKTRSGLIRLME